MTIPAQEVEAEDYVLGAMLAYPNVILTVTDHLDPADFYRPSNSTIYRAIVELDAKGEPADALTVIDTLERTAQLENAGGRTRLHELAHLAPAASNVVHHARLVREAADLRRVAEFGRHVQQLAHEKQGEPAELLDRVEQMAYELGDRREARQPTAASVAQTLDELTRLRNDPQELLGASTGFPDLDRITQGFRPGNMTILAARPSMGKTALAVTIAGKLAVQQGLPVEYFSMEMSRSEILHRLFAMAARVDLQRLQNPRRLTEDEWARVCEAAERIAQAPLEIDDSGTLRPIELRSRVRRATAKRPVSLVIVDYLQLMAGDKPRDSKTQEVTEISRAIKVMARDLDISVLALAQLNRGLEQRVDKRPLLSDLRDSGALEQDADLVWFLYRECMYNEAANPGIAELDVAKHRNGPRDKVKLWFREELAEFGSAQVRLAGDLAA